MYMAKVEGRKAAKLLLDELEKNELGSDTPVEAFHMPALKNIRKKWYRPTRSLILSAMLLKKVASTRTEIVAKNMRTTKKAARFSIATLTQRTNSMIATYLVTSEYHPSDARRNVMEENIRPTSKGIRWRQFPGLESIALVQEMQWFPEIIHYDSNGMSTMTANRVCSDLRRSR